MIFYIIVLSFAHMGVLGPIRYLIIAPTILLIFAVGKSIYFTYSFSYSIGSLLYFTSGILPTLATGNPQSFTYLPFILSNIILIPIYSKLQLSTREISFITFYFFLTLLLFPGAPFAEFIYGNANNYATVSLCGLYFALLCARRSTLNQALISIPFIAFAILSQSRTQLAATLLILVLYFAQKVFRFQLRYTAALGLLAMGTAYQSLMMGDPYGIITIVQDHTIGAKSYRGLSYRDVLLFSSLKVLDAHPFGVGWGQSGIALKTYTGETLSPHNTYLKIAVEGGWIAMLGYLIMLFGHILRRPTPLSVAFLIGIGLRGLFESATPFTLSLVSVMLVLPFFLNERSVILSQHSFWQVVKNTLSKTSRIGI